MALAQVFFFSFVQPDVGFDSKINSTYKGISMKAMWHPTTSIDKTKLGGKILNF